jgi:hypothetical protein
MKKMIVILSLLVSGGAFASQEFHCAQLQKDGSYLPSSFGINLVNTSEIEVLSHDEVIGTYHLDSKKTRLWTIFTSGERLSVTLKVEGKMFWGRSGFIKQSFSLPGQSETVETYFCKPGDVD